MDFSLSEEEVELQKLARQILGEEASKERLQEVERQEYWLDEKLWAALAEAGLLGVGLAEGYGGMALGFEAVCLLAEEVGYAAAPVPVVPVLASATLPIQRFGNDEQRQRLLPDIARGESLVTAALIEPGNEDACSPACSAKPSGDGYLLEGVKTCVPVAHAADRILLGARLEGGVGVFLLDPKAGGVTLAAQETTAGEPQFELTLAGARVAADDLLAGAENGAEVLRWTALRTAAAYCAMTVGVVDRSTRMTAEYTAEREQFGVKIATFQAVGQRAANCYIDLQCLRLVTQQAVSLLDRERAADDEVMIAKIWAGDVSHRVSHAAQHLHGGIGVDRDYPLFRYCLWAKHLELTHGASARLTAELGERIAREFSA